MPITLVDENLQVVPVLNQVTHHKRLLLGSSNDSVSMRCNSQHKVMGSKTEGKPYNFAAKFTLSILEKLNISCDLSHLITFLFLMGSIRHSDIKFNSLFCNASNIVCYYFK
jgi:hypothetical protein